MTVKIIIKRTVKENMAREMIPLFRKMRSLAVRQPGYISGETLKSLDRTDSFVVISTWDAAEDWEQWLLNPERKKLQDKMDLFLEGQTEYEMFQFGLDDKEII
ncbi:MAG: antibiotic biosynthesis monooxygenase family protein [Thermodesulfobacteriota bacterium]